MGMVKGTEGIVHSLSFTSYRTLALWMNERKGRTGMEDK